jgi:hypothetical protein
MRRVLTQVGPNQYRQEKRLRNMEGAEIMAPITQTGIFTPSEISGDISEFFINPTMQNQNNYQNQSPAAVGMAETASGRMVSYRSEADTGVSSAGVRRPLRFVISSTAAGPTVLYLGDGSGLVRAKDKNFNIGIPANVTVGGTYDANTHGLFESLTKSAGLDLHGIHIAGYDAATNAEDATIFDEGKITLMSVGADFQNLSEVVLPLADLLSAGDFRSNIREDASFRFKAGAMSAVKVDIPAGAKMVITFRKISAVGLPGHYFSNDLF